MAADGRMDVCLPSPSPMRHGSERKTKKPLRKGTSWATPKRSSFPAQFGCPTHRPVRHLPPHKHLVLPPLTPSRNNARLFVRLCETILRVIECQTGSKAPKLLQSPPPSRRVSDPTMVRPFRATSRASNSLRGAIDGLDYGLPTTILHSTALPGHSYLPCSCGGSSTVVSHRRKPHRRFCDGKDFSYHTHTRPSFVYSSFPTLRAIPRDVVVVVVASHRSRAPTRNE